MIETLEQWDRELMLFLNGLHAPFLDFPMELISGVATWFPLYALLLYGLGKKYGWSRWWLWVLAPVLTVAMTDWISVNLFKEVFERYRPSHNLEIQDLLHYVGDYRGGQFGFVSSHATTSFGIATIMTWMYRNRKIALAMYIWAAIVSYSRIYLGVHYPGDIAGGILLGLTIGCFTGWLFTTVHQKKWGSLPSWT
ncbi:phosphatase PAP2 family protein [bacterium SCSIO 12741]|nr:phosphatase PAP2 family protein [bacterium SCSIO 12741]